MKAQMIKIDGVDRDDLIVLIEPTGNWSVITTQEAVKNFTASYATMSEAGVIERYGEMIGTEDDVTFVGGPFNIEFNVATMNTGIQDPNWQRRI